MERTNALIVGAQRAGKTFLAEKYLRQYAKSGGVGVVYNPGMPGDYSDFHSVQILSVDEYKNLWEIRNGKTMKQHEMPRVVEWFKYDGSYFHLNSFVQKFRGKCVKIERIISHSRSEAFFFNAVYKYFYDCFVAFDDCRTMFQRGLSPEMIGLMSRINHAGKQFAPNPENIGIDMALIFHGFKAVNPEAYSHVNLVIQFKTTFAPIMPNDAEEIEPTILDNYEKLKDAKKYSHFEYSIHKQENLFYLPS